MIRPRRFLGAGALPLVLASCARPPLAPPPAAPPPIPWAPPLANAAIETPDAPFRERAPEPEAAPKFTPPAIAQFTLKNGVRVLFVERHDLPIVSARLVLKTGAGDLEGERVEVINAMGALLEQGTKSRTAIEIANDYDALGAGHDASMEWDTGGASIKVLTSRFAPALLLMADVVLHPNFPEAEIDRWRTRAIGRSEQQKTMPASLASSAIATSVFGREHPYGTSPIQKEEAIRAITRAEVVHAYAKAFVPANAVIAIAGDVNRDALVPILERAFGEWKGGAAPKRRSIAAHGKTTGARVTYVERKGAPQTQVYVADVGVPFTAPDHDATLVMNAILGGMFSSRINLSLREEHAYTYGAHSAYALRHGAGWFRAGGPMVAAHTADALQELRKEIDAIRTSDVTAEELNGAKESLLLSMPARFESVHSVTDALAELAVYDLPLDEYAKRVDRVRAVTAADVKRAANAHLHPSAMHMIVVGDPSAKAAVEALKLGPIETRDAYGDVLSSSPPK